MRTQNLIVVVAGMAVAFAAGFLSRLQPSDDLVAIREQVSQLQETNETIKDDVEYFRGLADELKQSFASPPRQTSQTFSEQALEGKKPEQKIPVLTVGESFDLKGAEFTLKGVRRCELEWGALFKATEEMLVFDFEVRNTDDRKVFPDLVGLSCYDDVGQELDEYSPVEGAGSVYELQPLATCEVFEAYSLPPTKTKWLDLYVHSGFGFLGRKAKYRIELTDIVNEVESEAKEAKSGGN